MKKWLSLLSIIFCFIKSQAQTVSYNDFKKLIPYLQTEDWKNAYRISSDLLSSSEKDTSDYRAIVLYANILSASGMVTQRLMTFEQLEKAMSKHKGHRILFSSHPITQKEGSLNSVKFSDAKSAKDAFITATNKEGAHILCFENIIFKAPVNPASFNNSFVRCGGKIDKIEFNPNKSLVWITRLTIKDGFARASQ
ncbi:hypothetical protein [Pedobacter zeae]|uniref:Uncharacterized protein n=1 Tax=Pedobacter zeae TaxID=1737356 RepID=A0A7W6KBL3_9SPHI|nr:hypothetical protein [Pedobacter zeae]MBB4108764.1 hypothetical protein [Pedobacter zeae]GGH08208.1 hypothetical protein GCM10007422_25610 [Pedobacter zeae]